MDPLNNRQLAYFQSSATSWNPCIIAVDIKSFHFSNSLISTHQFRFRPGLSTLDMLLQLSQQWMEALNIRHEIRAVYLDTSWAFDAVWYPTLLSKLSAYGIQGQLHYCSQSVALNGTLSSPLPVKAGVPQSHILSPILFLIFIIYLHRLWEILFISLLMTPTPVKTFLILQIGRLQPLPSL